jgi:hypothetical protein
MAPLGKECLLTMSNDCCSSRSFRGMNLSLRSQQPAMRSLLLLLCASTLLCVAPVSAASVSSPLDKLLGKVVLAMKPSRAAAEQMVSHFRTSMQSADEYSTSINISELTVDPAVAGSYSSTLQSALRILSASQANESTPFFPPFSLEKFRGLYPSYISFNDFGSILKQDIRRDMGIWDNNGFVTNWVLALQLECIRAGAVSAPVGDGLASLLMALNATQQFHENDDPITTGSVDFWHEIKDAQGRWEQYPTNIADPLNMAIPIAAVLAEWCAKDKSICPIVQPFIDFVNSMREYLAAFGIPADFDDSGVNLALGGILSSIQNLVPDLWQMYSSQLPNQDPKGLMDELVKFSYKPFSSDWNENSIDPRSYYWLRPFLHSVAAEATSKGLTPSLMLITTWVDDVKGSERDFDSQHKMPFLTNNVDGSVLANALFGVISSLLQHSPADGSGTYASFVSIDLMQLITNSTSLVAYIVDSQILLTRNDLVLLYYPPWADLYYFASRSLRSLESADLTVFGRVYKDNSTQATLEGIRDTLANSLRKQGTETLLQLAIKNSSAPGELYWEQFLGLADVDAQGKKTPHGDDRLFTTSMVSNALFSTWGIQDPRSGNLSFIPATPSYVFDTLKASCSFLNSTLTSGELRVDNAFFSGSVKGSTTMPSDTA